MTNNLILDSARPQRTPVSRLAAWFTALFSHGRDRRSAPRSCLLDLCAYYWEGGVSSAHEILNISETGVYIATPAHWYPGTVIELTIQKGPCTEDGPPPGPDSVLRVPSRVVRCDPDGAGVRFVYAGAPARRRVREFLEAMHEGGR